MFAQLLVEKSAAKRCRASGRVSVPATRATRGSLANVGSITLNARPRPATPRRSLRSLAQTIDRPPPIFYFYFRYLRKDARQKFRIASGEGNAAMMTAEENELLCRVEGNAPMGQIMRRHWIAACLSEEVGEPDGTPGKVRLLGEGLVVFRDSQGPLGGLDEYCSHRRASLVFARNEECGLRCLYHGWKFDVDGNVVEMASEPANSLIPERVKHMAYPVREAGGFVWAYMGPLEEMREFEPPAFAPTSEVRVSATKVRVRCNWAQILEGQIDSAHSSSLHSSDMVPAQVDSAKATEANWLRPSTDKAPRFQIERTSYGFRYAAIRRPIKNEATHDYIRTTVYIAPFTALIPPNNVHNVATLLTPEDDYHTMFYFIAWNGPDKPGIDAEAWRKFNVLQWGVDVDRNFNAMRTRDNLYHQDRAAMKQGN